MSQQDESDLKAAAEKVAKEWRLIDSVLFNRDIPQGRKLYVLGHLRTANSQTGLMWAAAERLAAAMSTQPQAAERMQRDLRKAGVLDLVEQGGGAGNGRTNIVKLKQPWLDEMEKIHQKWRDRHLPPLKEGAAGCRTPPPAPEGGSTPASQGGTLPPLKEGNPTIYPTILSDDIAKGSKPPSRDPSAPLPSHSRDPLKLGMTEPGPSCMGDTPESGGVSEGIPWIEPEKMNLGAGRKGKRPITYSAPLHYDRDTGRLCLVNNAAGLRMYQSLRDDYGIDVIKQGMTAAAGKAAGKPGEALGGLVRQYCGYALEKQSASPRANFARFQP